MVGIKNLSLLALAGSALAAPQGGFGGHQQGGDGVYTHTDFVYTTVMVTVTAGQEPTSSYVPAPAPTTTTTTTTTEAPAPAPTTEAPAPAPTTSSAPSTGSSGSGDWLSVLNEWRGKMGMSSYKSSQQLIDNAMDCLSSMGSDPNTLTHKLNPGSYAQVLAGGGQDQFQEALVGGWLCEMPSLPGLSTSICQANGAATYSNLGGGNTETGHAEILSSSDYQCAGCGWLNGKWDCDFSFTC